MKKETFLALINHRKEMENEIHRLNKDLSRCLTGDSSVLYVTPLEIMSDTIIDTIKQEFGVSKELAEWLAYDGTNQIEDGGTTISGTKIKSFDELYDYLINL